MFKELAQAIEDIAIKGGRLSDESKTFLSYVLSEEFEELTPDSEEAAERVQTVFDAVSERLDNIETRISDVETEIGDMLATPKKAPAKKG